VYDPAEWQVDPAEVGREQHDSALRVQWPRRPHADSDDLGAGKLASGLIDGALGQRNEAVQHVLLACLGRGGLTPQRMQRRAVLGDTADDEIGASDVNPENESHAIPPHR
jgi:hypothetical protein